MWFAARLPAPWCDTVELIPYWEDMPVTSVYYYRIGDEDCFYHPLEVEHLNLVSIKLGLGFLTGSASVYSTSYQTRPTLECPSLYLVHRHNCKH